MLTRSLPCLVIAFFVAMCSCFCSYSQVEKIKFGNVSIEALSSTTYPADTTAEAVILSSKGFFNGSNANFTHHIRVKILKSSGTKWGNWVINVPSKSSIKGIVYNLQGNEVIKEDLKNSSIFEEMIVDKFYVYKIFLPNVKVGSVIDFQYFFTGIPFEWRFQDRIPTVYNELVFEESPYVRVSKSQFGFEPIQTVSPTKWVATNVPGFRMEPYLNDYSNYISKFVFQPISFNGYAFASSWEKVNNLLMVHTRFGELMLYCAFLNDKAKEIKELNVPVKEKVALAYAYIQENIKWNKQSAILGTTLYRSKFLSDHSGNSAEINLLLTALLKKIGITAYPVVLSTRDNGLLLQHMPSIYSLNHVISYVRHDDVEMVLDATAEKLPPGILPINCINGSGLIVVTDKAEWINLDRGYKKKQKQFIAIKISEDGTGTASVKQLLSEYGYLEWVDSREADANDEKYMRDLETKHSDLKIKKYTLNSADAKALQVDEAFEMDISNRIIDLGNELALSPHLLSPYSENPFKSEERKYPVDLLYPIDFSSTISVEFPATFKLKSLPAAIRLETANKSASFTMLSSKNITGVQFRVNFKIEKAIFSDAEYGELRQFYSVVVKKLNESIEITK